VKKPNVGAKTVEHDDDAGGSWCQDSAHCKDRDASILAVREKECHVELRCGRVRWRQVDGGDNKMR